MTVILMWTLYAALLASFARIAWRGRLRLLMVLAAVMVTGFAGTWAYVDTLQAKPDYSHSTDFAAGMMGLLAAAVMLGPLIVAAIAYPIGRLWAR